MSARFSILLIVIGAILTFLVDHQAQGISIETLGLAFLAGGIVGLLFTIVRRIGVGPFRARRGRIEPETPRDDRREAAMRDRV